MAGLQHSRRGANEAMMPSHQILSLMGRSGSKQACTAISSRSSTYHSALSGMAVIVGVERRGGEQHALVNLTQHMHVSQLQEHSQQLPSNPSSPCTLLSCHDCCPCCMPRLHHWTPRHLQANSKPPHMHKLQSQSSLTLPTHHHSQEDGGEDEGGGLHAAMGLGWLQMGHGRAGCTWLSMHIMPRAGGWLDLARPWLVG